MKCLVTGAAGFIGSRLATCLVADGHTVVGLDDLSTGSPLNLVTVPEIDLRIGDVRDQRAVDAAVAGCEVVFHLAAVRSVVRSLDEPGLSEAVNARGTVNVLLAAQTHGARVVLASSSSVYGHQECLRLREDLLPQPLSPYAASKLAAEVYCQAWWRSFSVPTVSLRYFNVYGPGMDPHGPYALVVPIFVQALLDGVPPMIHGNGEQARDFTYLDDVVAATILAGSAPPAAYGQVFNVGGGQRPTSIRELLELIARELSVDVEPRFGPARAADMVRTEADVSRARKVLGYEPKVGIEEGIARTVAWFRADGQRSHAGGQPEHSRG
jgi:UDP-glucose 4-epimerase